MVVVGVVGDAATDSAEEGVCFHKYLAEQPTLSNRAVAPPKLTRSGDSCFCCCCSIGIIGSIGCRLRLDTALVASVTSGPVR
jgi:hypothetical protein